MVTTVAISRDAAQVAVLLNSPEIGRLIFDLDATRWTGRPGYPIRTMVGAALVKSVYALPTRVGSLRLAAVLRSVRPWRLQLLGHRPPAWVAASLGVAPNRLCSNHSEGV